MKNNIITYFLLSVIISVSFLLFSSAFYPLLNSDDALSILMLHDFRFPDNIYFWGQNRYGAIVPLFGQFFYKVLGLSPLWAESITHYLILIIGYFAFCSFLKSNFTKLIFAVIWFCPILYFSALLRFYPGLQYSIIAILFYLFQNYKSLTQSNNKVLVLVPIIIISIIAVWISDLAIITITLSLFVLGLVIYLKRKKDFSFFIIEHLIIIVGYVIGAVVIYTFKNVAPIPDGYQQNQQLFNSLNDVAASLQIISNTLSSIFLFQPSNYFISIYAWLATIILGALFFFSKNQTKDSQHKKWITILLLDGVVLIVVILLSHWAFLNGVARRYFTGVYIVFWLAYLISIESIPDSIKKKFLQIGICATVIVGIMSTAYNYKYVYPKRLSSKASVVKEFEQLGKIGIIANFWNSYGTSFVNPNLIKATPHDKSTVRNFALVDSVFAQPRLYLIRDMWLDSFPDTLNQFGRTLIKVDSSFNMGNCEVNQYKVIVNKK
jgi:hypothetical protein